MWHARIVAFKRIYDAQDDIPEPLRDYYVERDGKWHADLDSDGPVPDVTKLTRALESERRLRAAEEKKRKELDARIAEMEAQRNAPPPDPPGSTLAPDIQKQLEAQKRAYDERLKVLEESIKSEQVQRVNAEKRLAEERFLDDVRRAALPFVHEDAIDDVINRVRPAVKFSDDFQPTLYDGETPLLSLKTPGAPMPVDEFVIDRVLKSAKHLLKPTSGAGVQGSASSYGAGGVVLTRAQAKDASLYARAKERAEKAGQELVIQE